MEQWVAAACAELGLDPAEVQVPVVLDLAGDVAHQVLRPGAPVTTYLLGVAVGRGADPVLAAASLSALTRHWPPAGDPAGRGAGGDGSPSAATPGGR
jgi:hypothetical protein